MDVVSVLQNQHIETLGAWLQAAGTILSAIASTPTNQISSSTQRNLNTVGLALQAAGSGLETEGQSTPFSLEYIGTAIGTIGILESLTTAIIEFPDETDTLLNIQGNLLQALGSSIAAVDETMDSTSLGTAEGIVGNLLQTVGSVIQVFGLKVQSQDQTSNTQTNEGNNHNQFAGESSQSNQANSYVSWNQQNGSANQNQDQTDGQSLIALGAWIQAIGAVIAAIGQQKEEMHELQLGIDE